MWLSGKESACQCRRCRFNFWVGNIPWRKKWQPTLVSLPGESPRTEKLGAPQSMGLQGVGHDWGTKQHELELSGLLNPLDAPLPFRVLIFPTRFSVNHFRPRMVVRFWPVTCDSYNSCISLGNEAWTRFCSDLIVGKLELSLISWQHSWRQITSLMAWI